MFIPRSGAAALAVFGTSLVIRGLTSGGRDLPTPGEWAAVQLIGFVTAVALAVAAVRTWLRNEEVWDERLHHRLLLAASSGFVTMLALAGTLLVAAPLVVLSDLAVHYLQVGTGMLALGVTLWEAE